MNKLILFLMIILAVSSCGEDDQKEQFACGYEVKLTEDIMPIIESNCNVSRCHLDAIAPFLDSKAAVMDNAEKISEVVDDGTMPPNSVLQVEEVDLILCWVEDGAKDN